jgi:hypothetical protein
MHDIPPVLELYAQRGLLYRVDGMQSVEDLHRQIAETLNARPVP